jgi:hypothetical protein
MMLAPGAAEPIAAAGVTNCAAGIELGTVGVVVIIVFAGEVGDASPAGFVVVPITIFVNGAAPAASNGCGGTFVDGYAGGASVPPAPCGRTFVIVAVICAPSVSCGGVNRAEPLFVEVAFVAVAAAVADFASPVGSSIRGGLSQFTASRGGSTGGLFVSVT